LFVGVHIGFLLQRFCKYKLIVNCSSIVDKFSRVGYSQSGFTFEEFFNVATSSPNFVSILFYALLVFGDLVCG
jgi:hypothetical protein